MLPYLTEEDAARAGDWLCQCVRSLAILHQFNPVAGQVTISLGLKVGIPSLEDSAPLWLKQADQALYAAKAQLLPQPRRRLKSTRRILGEVWA